jgi:hypothetical protein
VYSDVEGGDYRVQITSHPTLSKALRVVSTGKERSGRELRAVEVVLKKSAVDSALYAPTIGLTGSARIFWGPFMALGSIHMTGSSNQLMPRKMSRGVITASGGYPDRDTNPTAPNTDSREWWSYNSYPVPDSLTVDLNYYKTVAQTQGLYYTSNQTLSSVVDTDDTKVRYFDGCNARFSGSKHFRGVLVVLGDLDFIGSGKEPEGLYYFTPPPQAWQEYQKNSPNGGDTCTGTDTSGGGGYGAADDGNYRNNANAEGDKTCFHQYPGDGGYHVVESSYSIKDGCLAHSQSGGGGGESPSFKGFVFVRGQISCAGSSVIHGAIYMDTGASWGGGSFQIFYDETLSVRTLGNTFSRVSWKEVPPISF